MIQSRQLSIGNSNNSHGSNPSVVVSIREQSESEARPTQEYGCQIDIPQPVLNLGEESDQIRERTRSSVENREHSEVARFRVNPSQIMNHEEDRSLSVATSQTCNTTMEL